MSSRPLNIVFCSGHVDWLLPEFSNRRFFVTATREDGSTEHWHRTGGNSIDHALEAQEAAGLGGVVRIVPLDQAEAA